jgi:hypothetical protein
MPLGIALLDTGLNDDLPAMLDLALGHEEH